MNTRTELLPPEVPETTVSPDLLQPLQIFSQLIIQAVGKDLKSDSDGHGVPQTSSFNQILWCEPGSSLCQKSNLDS